MKQGVLTQEKMLEIMLPLLKTKGKVYKKVKPVFARQAKEGEVIHTKTDDGHETSNTAKEGDFIIKNQTKAEELYIIGAKKFHDRYVFQKKDKNGFSEYAPKGKVIALQMTPPVLKDLNFKKEFHFIASWKEEMIVKENDFLVCPLDYSSIYRIARQEFFETYQLVE